MCMEKKLKRMFGLLGVLGIIISILQRLDYNIYLTGWIFMVAIWVYVLRFTMMVYDDCKRIYPVNRTCKSVYLKDLFFWLYENERIPKCLIIQACTLLSVFGIYTVMFIILGIGNITSYAIDIFLSYCLWGFLLILYGYYGMYISIFLERFKRINKYNIRYIFFITYNSTCKWPVSTVLGKCKVVSCVKKNQKIYAAIQMQNNSEIYENVLVLSKVDANKIYELHEICQVKYIV